MLYTLASHWTERKGRVAESSLALANRPDQGRELLLLGLEGPAPRTMR